jgi:photosystem II stability/assembly factor-like uncharacterized protein
VKRISLIFYGYSTEVPKLMSTVGIVFLALVLGACSSPELVCSSTQPKSPTPEVQVNEALSKVADVPQGPEAYTLNCISDRICWIGDFLKLWRTDDGGGHWRLIYSSKSDLDHIVSFDYVDADLAWIITFEHLYKSEDGGATWIEQNDPLPSKPKGQLSSVKFLKGGRIGWAGGGVYRSPTREEQRFGVPTKWRDQESGLVLGQAIAYTEDGGKTWVRQSFPRDQGTVYNISMTNEQRGIVLGSTGGYFTVDAGKRWQAFTFSKACAARDYGDGYEARFLGFYNRGLDAAWLTFDDGRIAKTINGGQTWCDILGPKSLKFESNDNYFKVIHFTDSSHGWGLGGNGFLYETKDDGKSWSKMTSGRFDDMYFLDDKTGWLISKAGIFRIGS